MSKRLRFIIIIIIIIIVVIITTTTINIIIIINIIVIIIITIFNIILKLIFFYLSMQNLTCQNVDLDLKCSIILPVIMVCPLDSACVHGKFEMF